jgi:hypothetical protein
MIEHLLELMPKRLIFNWKNIVKQKRGGDRMRTCEEILARIEEIVANGNDYFGVQAADLTQFLPPRMQIDLLCELTGKKELSGEDIELIKAEAIIPTKENILEKMRGYLPFAWEVARGGREISAIRSICHMQAWLWLLGDDALQGFVDIEYEFYGRQQSIYCSEICGFDWGAEERYD